VSFSSRPWFCFQKDWQLVDKPSRQTTLQALLSVYTLRLHVSFGSWFPSSIHELACFLFLWTWVIFQPAEEEDIAQRELSLSLSVQCPFSFFGPLSVWVFSQIMCWELWALWWIGCHGRERERENAFLHLRKQLTQFLLLPFEGASDDDHHLQGFPFKRSVSTFENLIVCRSSEQSTDKISNRA